MTVVNQEAANNLRGSSTRSLQATPENKAPLNPDKDAAQRPFAPSYKDSGAFQERPSSISYFPDQVFSISYVAAIANNPKSSTTSHFILPEFLH